MPMYDFICVNNECKEYRLPKTEMLTLSEYDEKKSSFRCTECKGTLKTAYGTGVVSFNYGGDGFYSQKYVKK